jgi:gamma-glutamylcyclotransferase (GGCT)/AIG2-like uncharacterized protein YtfP
MAEKSMSPDSEGCPLAARQSGHPEERLIVYGTLVPGEMYHFLLADLPGTWEQCAICGHMGEYGGFKAFYYDAAGPEHPAWLLISPGLPGRFPELDEFEGEGYDRVIIPARLNDRWVMAQIYVAASVDTA